MCKYNRSLHIFCMHQEKLKIRQNKITECRQWSWCKLNFSWMHDKFMVILYNTFKVAWLILHDNTSFNEIKYNQTLRWCHRVCPSYTIMTHCPWSQLLNSSEYMAKLLRLKVKHFSDGHYGWLYVTNQHWLNKSLAIQWVSQENVPLACL